MHEYFKVCRASALIFIKAMQKERLWRSELSWREVLLAQLINLQNTYVVNDFDKMTFSRFQWYLIFWKGHMFCWNVSSFSWKMVRSPGTWKCIQTFYCCGNVSSYVLIAKDFARRKGKMTQRFSKILSKTFWYFVAPVPV